MPDSNFSRALRGLEKKGLVRRDVDPQDGRRFRLYPTVRAQENLRQLRAIWSDLLDGVVPDPDEVEAVNSVLRRIETHLVEKARRGT